MPETVVLSGLRCGGGDHGGCQAQCLLNWKEAWLGRPAEARGQTDGRDDPAFARLEELTLANTQPTRRRSSPLPLPGDGVASCERAGAPVEHGLLRRTRSASGNVGVWRFVRVMTGVALYIVGRRLRLLSRSLAPFGPEELPDDPAATPLPKGLRPGDLVRVRPRNEIARTLDKAGKHKGLWFDKEMEPFCGRDRAREVEGRPARRRADAAG